MSGLEAASSIGRRRVVVVDDDTAYLRAVSRTLAAHEAHYDVALLSSGDLAIEHLGHHEADVVVMDVYMPGTNGIETCRVLKARPSTMRVVLVTSYLTDELSDAALLAGADTTLQKPYDLIGLLAVMAQQPARVEDPLVERELVELLGRGRDTLPPLEATVLAMRHDQHLSVAAIARELDLTLGRVVQMHARGIERLRSQRVPGA
jgi:CheY-like chemotaxis protein